MGTFMENVSEFGRIPWELFVSMVSWCFSGEVTVHHITITMAGTHSVTLYVA